MTTTNLRPVPASTPASDRATYSWRTRDIVVASVIGVVFGVVFLVWQSVYGAFGFLNGVFPVLQDWVYGVWLVPAVLGPLIVRKPGAAIVAELIAAGVAAFLGSAWGVDALLSGLLQGLAAEAVFAIVRYRSWSLSVLAAAAVASAVAAWAHDWVLYYAGVALALQVARLVLMALSAIAFAALGSIALRDQLRRAGVLEGFPD
jgi:energy-coupling factor transport system substrate-specific component